MTKHTYRDLAHYLKATGTSQAKLAAEVGTIQSVISMIAAHRRRPSYTMAVKIVRVTGIPFESFWVKGERRSVFARDPIGE